MKLLAFALTICMFAVSTPFALAGSTFKVGSLVNSGKKPKEVKSTLTFQENSFTVTSASPGQLSKEFKYADVTSADYSYAKKPLLSTGGAIATAVLLGVVAIPFLFMKKKQHWLSLRTENDYIVLRLDKNNFRQIQNELEVHKVPVATVNEDDSKKGK